MAMDPQQKLSSYHDSPKAYSSVEKNSDKLLAENKQFLAEQQRALAEQQRDTITEQRAAFAEQKALAQQKLLASQRSKEETRPTTDSLNNSLKETRPNDNRLGLTESSPLQVKVIQQIKFQDSFIMAVEIFAHFAQFLHSIVNY